ncbi:DUF4129 domain-containing protein, partial [Reinekea sp.]|uniref:DUF4129 domain-containing protein n=1 Tax=Reinekea sp. TaxID=1970455 RepID=UPI00257CBB81
QMVSPERIQRGLESAVADEDTFLANSPLSWLKYRQLLWLQELRQQLGAIGHYWDNWVVGYNARSQLVFLSKYLEKVDASRLGMLMLTVFFGLLGIVALFVLRTRNKRVLTGVDQQYLRFCQLLSKQGLVRYHGEGPWDYSRRISRERPDLALVIQRVTQEFIRLNYEVGSPNVSPALKNSINAFRFSV